MTCSHCNSWTITNANFCFQCGVSLVSTSFEYNSLQPASFNWKDKMLTTVSLATIAAGASFFANWPTEFIALLPLGYLLYTPISKLLLDILGKLPEKQSATVETTLKIEHTSLDKKHWLIADVPPGIELKHIQHIAKVCETKPFSRRNCCQAGKLSQGEFEKIRDFFLEMNYTFYRNRHSPTTGMILTERGKRLLKKSLSPTL